MTATSPKAQALPESVAPGLDGDPARPADAVLELPMRLLGRTVKRTAQAMAALAPGQVLAVHTDDP